MHEIPADRNKTDLTHIVTEGAAKWLSSIGAKCIETEIQVEKKWTCDLAAFWRPTPTEATEQKLIPRAKTYPYGAETAAVEAWHAHHDARLAAYRALPNIITIVVEVKTSRPDFRKETMPDGKFNRSRVADIQVLAVPMDMLEIGDAPRGWWVLSMSAHDGSLLFANRNLVDDIGTERKLELVASIAERRHNRTENAFWSALQKRQRLEMSKRDGQI